MAIEIVDFPIKHGDFPWQNVSSPEGIHMFFATVPSSKYIEIAISIEFHISSE